MAMQRSWGIDVSYHQGVIDWAAVKATGCDWVILRAGYGFRTIDTQFVNNIEGAIAAGFENIGVYWFCYSHNTDDVAIEAASCIEALEPYRSHITLPVWFDFEGASYTYVQNTYGVSLTALQIRDLATAWCSAVIDAGYSTGIYSNRSDGDRWFKLPNGQYLWQQLGVQYWYARYGANNETNLFVIPAFEETALAEHPETDFLQYSDVGRVDGINSQRVDLNVRYTETPEPPTPPPTPVINVPIGRNSIEYVEIRDAGLNVIGIIDTAQSIIWHSVYYGVGDFEIYIQATPEAINLLQKDRYVTRPDNREVGIIERITISDDVQSGIMITATGRFAKSLLDRRLIYNLTGNSNAATVLSGNVEAAVRGVVNDNAVDCVFDGSRAIAVLSFGAPAGIGLRIVDADGNAAEKQVSYENLLTYTDSVLAEYRLSAVVVLDEETRHLLYTVFQGADRSSTNTDDNQPIIFSQEFDNLTESVYTDDTTAKRTAALIGGAGEGVDRFYSLIEGTENGIDRREVWVDASSINRTYKDANDEEQTYTDAEYTAMLKAQGKQTLAPLVEVETFSGTIDITNGNWVYNRDFALGDIVTVQDNYIGKFADVRISEITEVQDENGYKIEAKYE